MDLCLLTVSDTRDEARDRSGALLRELAETAGHRILEHRRVPDEAQRIRSAVIEMAADPRCCAVLVTGGTGLSPRDVTHEAVAGLLEKRLDGFGELFRSLSYAEIGPAAMLSRAVAGSLGSVFVAVLPGSTGGVRLAMEKLILPELGHVAALLGSGVDRAAEEG